MKPISPSDVVTAKQYPDDVIAGFNEIIALNYRSGISSFTQEEIVKRLMKKGYARREIFDRNLLDVEDLYRDAGWKVDYDKPGYNEAYEPTFTFSVKSRG